MYSHELKMLEVSVLSILEAYIFHKKKNAPRSATGDGVHGVV